MPLHFNFTVIFDGKVEMKAAFLLFSIIIKGCSDDFVRCIIRLQTVRAVNSCTFQDGCKFAC